VDVVFGGMDIYVDMWICFAHTYVMALLAADRYLVDPPAAVRSGGGGGCWLAVFPGSRGGGGTATVATDGHTYLLAKCRRCFGRSEQQEQDEAGIYSCLARGVVSRSVSFLSLID